MGFDQPPNPLKVNIHHNDLQKYSHCYLKAMTSKTTIISRKASRTTSMPSLRMISRFPLVAIFTHESDLLID